MDSIGVTAFEGVYSGLPDSRAQLRVGTDVIARAVTSGRLITAQAGEQGTVDPYSMTVRLLATDEKPRSQLIVGEKIEVKHIESEGWIRVRIGSRKASAGVISLGLEALYE